MPQSDSSPEATAADTAVVDDQSTDVKTTETSSDSVEGVETPSYLDAVEAALDTGKEESPTSEKGEEQAKLDAESSESDDKKEDGDSEDGDKKDDETKITDDEIQTLSTKTQKRIRGLVDARNTVQSEVEGLKPRAEQWDSVISFMRENNIQPAEFDNALTITSLINSGDYKKALDTLTPIYRELASKAGELLPKDLADDVQLGRLDEPRARELSRSRAAAQSAEFRERQTRERTAFEQEQQQIDARVGQAVTAVDDWAKEKASSDPDWSEKHLDVAEQMELELSRSGPEGFPKSKKEAIRMAEDALKRVETRYKRFKPKPQEQLQATGQGASPKAKAKPTSYMDAIDQALYG